MDLAAGIDTWSLAWYPRPVEVAHLRELATVPAGRGRWLPESIDGHRVGVYDSGLVAVEGHPAEDRLARADELQPAAARVRDAVATVTGVELSTSERSFSGAGFHGLDGVRRLDAALDLKLDRHEGLAVLAALAAVRPPAALEVVTHRGRHGLVQSVAWQGRRGRVGRAYDKSLEANSGPVGTLVRLERQQRFRAGCRRPASDFDGRAVRETWARRFVPLWRASKGVTVMTDLRQLCERVHELTIEGALTRGQATGVLAHLVIEATGQDVGRSRQTRWRHRRRCEDLGLVLVDDEAALAGEPVDVHALLERAFEPDVWE